MPLLQHPSIKETEDQRTNMDTKKKQRINGKKAWKRQLTSQKKSNCTTEYRNKKDNREKYRRPQQGGREPIKKTMKTRKEEEEQTKMPKEYKFRKKKEI
jgi:hypothetical protein